MHNIKITNMPPMVFFSFGGRPPEIVYRYENMKDLYNKFTIRIQFNIEGNVIFLTEIVCINSK